MSDDPVALSQSLTAVVRALRPEPQRRDGRRATSTSVAAADLAGVFGRWHEAVGELVSSHAQPVKWDGASLVVEVDEPAWATQLRFLDSDIKRRLSEVAGVTVSDIEVRVASKRRRAPRGDD